MVLPQQHVTGAAQPTATPPVAEKGTLLGTLVHLWPYIWPGDRADLKTRVIWSVVLLLFAKLATLSVPFTFKWAIDALNGTGSAPVAASNWVVWLIASPVLMTMSYGAMRILMAVLTQWRDGIFARVAMHAVRKLATITFIHMHELSLRFHLERKTGGLTRVLERGREGIEVIVRMVILQLIPTIVEVSLLMAVLLWQFDWRYVVVTLITVMLYMYYTYIATEWRIGIRRKMNDSDTEANTKAIDSLLNYETVKYFSAEAREAQRYDKSVERYEEASVRTYTSLAVLNTGQAVIFTLGLTATMLMCAIGVRNGTNTVGDFVLVNAMMIQLYQPLNFMGMVYREIKQAIIDIEKMFNVLARDPEVKDIPGAKPLAVSSGSVRFEDVRFAYETDRPILKGISFEVPAGKTVAIVGPSGAGKSTISRLLFRLYDVSGGKILIDGQDIKTVTQASLRSAIGMVPQDTVLFNDTIRYNIRYGRWDATDTEVEEAARLAQIDHFIRMAPKGYDTQVGERGLKLSGGEKQRVAIARTVLKAPPILVLDEATSALDTHTEHEIQGALDRVAKNRTSLVIAHRLSTIVGADEIIVLDQGRIAERGTHARLLAADGLYASMWNRQREAEAARERLAQVDDDGTAPNRLPPAVTESSEDSTPDAGEKPLPTAAE
ncbi:ABC transporter ATP-binding protein/permease [Bradyrhizobium sp. BEA-2-5]|uniref:ABCB family ABC transporter ATP-binding protein/permease n=1 Tax=Bradyrhizobium sp. BEA-2-5 TaxID=3080015 RepID=UPI00293E9A2B|nr:ABC transporter ATP-binding protein/permease [Bradyrhizobium sp. BEA-2-5]WOH84655.1 ABC transporter ATP-binding protein/permease [Bradyrhizobium sp. BEA-2-5]